VEVRNPPISQAIDSAFDSNARYAKTSVSIEKLPPDAAGDGLVGAAGVVEGVVCAKVSEAIMKKSRPANLAIMNIPPSKYATRKSTSWNDESDYWTPDTVVHKRQAVRQ
jgi:hypothetical protein